MVYNYDEDWGEDDDSEYDVIETSAPSYNLKTLELEYDEYTSLWTVLEEVAAFFERNKLSKAYIHHLSNETYDDGDCLMTVIYSV